VDRASQAQVARYVVTCNAVGAILARREQIPAAKITTIYNGLALPAASQPVPPDWPFPPGPPVLITIGRLSPEKDHAALLNACAALNRQGLAWRLLVLGEGRQRQALEQLSADLGLQAQVYWAGNQSPVFPWLAHADIFVLPSRWEGVSMALLEAMACGLPVVATAVGGTPEVVLEGQTGLLAPPGDSDALAQALAALLRDPSRRHTLGAAGRARLAEEFSIDRTLERLEDLYRRLLSAKETPDG
jgi:glycosyltransferase involved in cell wall biosynthesis